MQKNRLIWRKLFELPALPTLMITELRIEIGDTVIEHEYAYNRSGVLQEYTVTTHSDIFERILTKTFNENGKTEREKQETWVDGVLQTRSESSYEYDANGNQIWTETKSYAYGETSVTEIEQVYDADGCLLRFWMEFRNETEDGDDFGVSIELADKEYENLDDPENYHPEYRSGRLERRLEVVDYELPKELDAAPNEIEMFEELLDELYIEAVYDDHGNCLEMEFALTGIMETEQETEYVAVRVPRNYQNPSKSDPQWLMTNPIS